MIGITSRNYASSYIFCQLDQSIRDYFLQNFIGRSVEQKKKQMLFIGYTLINFENMALDTKNK